MIDRMDLTKFSRDWVAAWNRRDVEAVLKHFADEVTFTSPVAQRIGFRADGIMRGKDDVRSYWIAALAKNFDLNFSLTGTFAGVDLLVITYSDQNGLPRTEVLKFRDGLVVEGHGTLPAMGF